MSEELFKEYTVVIGTEMIDKDEILIVETQFLSDEDVAVNYEWMDDEKSLLKPKSLVL